MLRGYDRVVVKSVGTAPHSFSVAFLTEWRPLKASDSKVSIISFRRLGSGQIACRGSFDESDYKNENNAGPSKSGKILRKTPDHPCALLILLWSENLSRRDLAPQCSRFLRSFYFIPQIYRRIVGEAANSQKWVRHQKIMQAFACTKKGCGYWTRQGGVAFDWIVPGNHRADACAPEIYRKKVIRWAHGLC